MDTHIKFVVYALNNIMGNQKYKCLEKVEFDWRVNEFDSEEGAIQALIYDEKTFESFVILKQIYIN